MESIVRVEETVMKHIFVALLILAATAGCMQKPAPVANETTSVPPAEMPAIAVEYVQVPSMQVYDRPGTDAAVTGQYGLSEAISILDHKGEWKMIRTFDGVGWVKAADLASAETFDKIDLNEPRFYVAPQKIDDSRARGEIAIQAKVNTDGAVVETRTVMNTTGMTSLAAANEQALQEAKFYPLVDKGSRKTFIYEYKVYY